MNQNIDRLYELLPVIHRLRDAEQGEPLKQLLQIVTEQVDVVEADISQLYENWFIETCQDWVVPYLGDLVGYRPVHEAGEPGDIKTPQGQQRNKILIPRREVANTIRYRRRKGTLALLELLSNDVAGWPARVVEFYKLLGWTQHLNHLRPTQGQTVDLRQGNALDLLDTPFDEIAHTVDIRRIKSPFDLGRYNIPDIGVFVWRLKSYSVTKTPAYCLEEVDPHCYTFSILGNDTPLYTLPQPEQIPTDIAQELNVPNPIRRRALEIDRSKVDSKKIDPKTNLPYQSQYYGAEQSFQIWEGKTEKGRSEVTMVPVTFDRIIIADLSNWQYRTPSQKVAVDPVLGRIAFPQREPPKKGVWVSYQYGFSTEIGGGEYERILSQPAKYALYKVNRQTDPKTIQAALEQWNSDLQQHPQDQKYHHAIIEITDSGAYTDRLNFTLPPHHSLQIRAGNKTRPVIRLLDYQPDGEDSLHVTLGKGSQLTLDGLLIVGRGIQIQGEVSEQIEPQSSSDGCANDNGVRVNIRDSTLVPGWGLHCDCEPKRPNEPSLEIFNLSGRIEIDRSIIGSIQVNQDEVKSDPLPIIIRDSIIDATDADLEAIDAPGCPAAHARLTILRSTVIGRVMVHSIDLAENTIFNGIVTTARRQQGCVRFCYVPYPSRTPRRYNCQPDLVQSAIVQELKDRASSNAGSPQPSAAELETARQQERDRVHPHFNSTRYSTPTYCQLSRSCAAEIKGGADDESEIGVFHNLYQPQRDANLRARLDEYTPAGMETGIIYVN
jgi:hypothetical protein